MLLTIPNGSCRSSQAKNAYSPRLSVHRSGERTAEEGPRRHGLARHSDRRRRRTKQLRLHFGKGEQTTTTGCGGRRGNEEKNWWEENGERVSVVEGLVGGEGDSG